MESNTNNSITLTQKRIASAKGLHIICAIVAMLLNIMAFAVLAVNITFSEIMFLAFPIALAVLDVIFFVKALFSNYRFRYAINGAIVHSVIVLLVSVAAFVVMGMLETQRGIVFVTISLYAMLLVHVVQSIAVLTTALLATKGGKSMRKILSILFAAIFIAGAVIYGRMLLVEGFFGQGGYTDYRTVVYKLNDDGTYTAIDVLDGYGTETVVPHKFNGQHVAYIDCAIFSHEEITKVKIDCDHPTETCDVQVGFVNVDNLNFMNEKLSIDTPAEHLDKLRKTLYAISLDEGSNLEAVYTSNAIKLANSIVPSDLGENKVYVSFDYDIETLKLVGMENIIPVWVREKGTTLDFAELKSHATGVSYIDNSNVDNAEHLVWCHKNLSEKIFKSIVDSEGNEINGAINANVDNAKITFENLYHITFIDDTDETRWSLPGNYRYLYDITGEQNFDCLITTESKIQSKIDAVVSHTNEHRKGFKLAFKTGSET